MTWDQIEGNWKQFKGDMKSKWGKLTDNDFTVIEGKRDKLSGLLQERYGYAKERAEEELDEFVDTLDMNRDEEDADIEETEHATHEQF